MRPLIATAAVLALAGLGACAQAPMPESYPLSYQLKMQAAAHWDLLAQHVAQRLNNQLPGGNQGISLYVAEPRPVTTFNRALHDLVVTHLVEYGFNVTTTPYAGALTVQLDTQVVHHTGRSIRPQPGSFVAIGGVGALGGMAARGPGAALGAGALLIGAAEFLSGGAGDAPDTEIIVSTSVLDGNMYRARLRDIYYVSDDNQDQYVAAPVRPDLSRRLEVVGS